MKKKAEKDKQADELKSQLANGSTVILSTFQGITVEEDTQLRRAVEAAGGHYRSGEEHGGGTRRRRDAEPRAAEESEGHQFDRVHEDRSCGAGQDSYEDRQGCSGVPVPRGMGRRARHFDRGNPAAFAQLPSKEELISKIMFMLNAPAQRMATVMTAVAAQSGGGGRAKR